MKELPILFSTPMVIALQREVDPKTQTRRANGFGVINDNPDAWYFSHDRGDGYFCFKNHDASFGGHVMNPYVVKMPYKKGDILYVREAYYDYGYWTENGKTDSGRQKWKFISTGSYVDTFYVADTDSPDGGVVRSNSYRKIGWYKRLARFMPKKYARIKLEVTGIGVERLKGISEDDAKSEGIERLLQSRVQLSENGPLYRDYMKLPEMFNDGLKARESFFSIWESINGKESLDSNPFVFVIKFKKI